MEAIRVERRDGLVTVTLDRPAKKNAIDARTWSGLDRALAEVAADPNDRALILTGAGGNFSAGADLSGNPSGKGLTGGPLQPIVQEMRSVGDIVLRLQRLPKPTLAKVDGVCVGVSLGLALACDLVLPSDRARFSEIGELDAVAEEWGRRLATGPTLALGLSKRLLDASSSVTLTQALEDEARCQHITHASKDVREGIAAFLERREPRFDGC
jgi:2-(1,2-epoxy-1,2-dihydrophenyl)acetyl-CoA isomerase